MQDKQSTVNYNLFLFPLSVTILFLSKWGSYFTRCFMCFMLIKKIKRENKKKKLFNYVAVKLINK